MTKKSDHLRHESSLKAGRLSRAKVKKRLDVKLALEKPIETRRRSNGQAERGMSKIVARTVEMFELFAEEKRPLSLTAISKILKIPMSSCHDVVHTLAAKGYVYETAPRSGYYPTRKLHDIATTIADHDSLLPRASAYLEDAMNSLEETVCLAKARNMSATYLAVIEPPNPLRVSVAVGGQIRSIFATSAGKAILGDLPEDEFEIFMKSARLKRLTPHTILSKVKFVEEIRVSRERGWYINKEESLLGVVTVSSQFRWNDALYIMTIAGPADRMTRKIRAAVEEVLQTCRALSAPKS